MQIELNKQYEFAGTADYKIDGVISPSEQITMHSLDE